MRKGGRGLVTWCSVVLWWWIPSCATDSVCEYFRGCGHSKGRTSWTGIPERGDYQAVMDHLMKASKYPRPTHLIISVSYHAGSRANKTLFLKSLFRDIHLAAWLQHPWRHRKMCLAHTCSSAIHSMYNGLSQRSSHPFSHPKWTSYWHQEKYMSFMVDMINSPVWDHIKHGSARNDRTISTWKQLLYLKQITFGSGWRIL